jgi:hypothetical protein
MYLNESKHMWVNVNVRTLYFTLSLCLISFIFIFLTFENFKFSASICCLMLQTNEHEMCNNYVKNIFIYESDLYSLYTFIHCSKLHSLFYIIYIFHPHVARACFTQINKFFKWKIDTALRLKS